MFDHWDTTPVKKKIPYQAEDYTAEEWKIRKYFENQFTDQTDGIDMDAWEERYGK
ncbi:hypothetical protein [Vibrio phage JSF2]|uniref:Uncharacterized protein ORF201 n=1 Tax=Vibrio phage ICP1 TaxID=979525 RepID=F1D1M5_9CAUD|nr:hypothetical protein ViPhICP1_gp203 [Vibrio phage ICP1]ADX88695.1 hypothetical protein TUST1-159_00975 [Vibrio phage ICP1_2006_B]ADX88921.1 hypothetical protein TUST1-17_00975 [Vibrio phage ICP1_2006_A]ADX89151.1 hypothetical protein TUST1-15_00995 [Vibrio phage ICP1_2005_A]APD17941.1 hypothetical protein [Vibrio phage JSF4]ASV41749.1 hypothetical protein [Vibrio phage JSF1]ASV41889.1 hypothetical protein [Vibrio phage JSF2]